MGVRVDWIDDRELLDKLMKLETQREDVGFFESGLAKIAFYNEVGTYIGDPKRKGRTPSRPFMRRSVRQHKDAVLKEIEDQYVKVLQGLQDQIDLNRAGAILASKMQLTGIHLQRPKNKPSTVRRKGFNDPLIDKGDMLGSIKHQKADDPNGDI